MLRTRSLLLYIAYVLTDMLSMYHGGIESSASHSHFPSIRTLTMAVLEVGADV